MTDVVVRDNTAAHRYEAVVDEDVVGFADYTLDQGVITFVHTEVDDAHEGQGVGSALARGAIDDVRAQAARTVRTTCPFISAWLRRHPENNDLLTAPSSS